MIDDGTRTMRETLAAVLEHLEGWHLETPYEHGANLVNGDGVRIWARLETYGANAGKCELSAGSPDGASYSEGDYGRRDETRPEVRVSLTRSPEVIARDLARRLLPAAVAYWETVAGRVSARLERAAARERVAGELAGVMSTTAREWRGDWRADIPNVKGAPIGNGSDGHHTVYGEFTADGADSVRLELRGMTPAQARELAAVIAGWRA